ncbi:MAG: GAF domain-containing protein [Chloroflexi bacterium]|nr:GAF domain-containing protein [Chloroflexota bacterium]MCI0575178.1 GAF domain-containing protein [Chloroflexota bacterium]MCI0647140.1 GAF domain-containing protein [Chloroflexota bacterium]MCI0729984.1 GAF domain-containing protein [Chloroflexota bacterium]
MSLLDKLVSYESVRQELRQAQGRLQQYRTILRLAGNEIERRNRGIRALTTFAYRANWLTEPAALLKLALAQALEIIETQIGALVLIDQETKSFYLGCHRGLTPGMVRILTGRQYDQGAAVLMPHLASGKGALLELKEATDPAERALLATAQVCSLISLPLQAGQQLLGALVVGAQDNAAFSPANLNFLIALSQQTAAGLDAVRVREKLWHFAETLLSEAAEHGASLETHGLGLQSNLPPLPPLQTRLANLVADLGGAMGAIFVLSPLKDDVRVSLAADYGLSPLFTSAYADFPLSAGLFPEGLPANQEWLIPAIDRAVMGQASPLLASLYEEGARSLAAVRLENPGHSAKIILVAATEPETLARSHLPQLLEEGRVLIPLVTEPSPVPTLPTHSVHVPALSHHPSTEDLEKLLAAMMEAEEESYRHNADLLALNTISEMLGRTLNLDQVIGQVVVQLREMLQVQAAWLYLLDDAGSSMLRLRAHEGLSERYVKGMRRLKVGDGFDGLVVQENKACFVNDVKIHLLRCQLLVEEEKVQAIAGVPLACPVERDGREESRVIGVLTIAMRQVYTWQPREIRLLTSVANQMALAINNGLLYAQVQEALNKLAASNQILKEINRQLLENRLTLPAGKNAAKKLPRS